MLKPGLKIAVISFLWIAACSSGSGKSPQPNQSDAGGVDANVATTEDISALVEQIRAKYKLPALAAAVYSSEGIQAIGAAGQRSIDDSTEVTVNDKWHLGSNTKAMTSTLVARLVDQKRARWDMNMAEAYPNVKVHAGYQSVTVEQMLAHRGGVASNPAGMGAAMFVDWQASQGPRLTQVSKFLAEAPSAEPGRWMYSNAGYMAAVAWAESPTNTWEQQMQTEVFGPLGMTECGFGFAATPGAVDQPWGHSYDAQSDRYEAVEPGMYADNPRGLGPAGTVHCSLQSWGKFLVAHLKAARGDASYLSTDARSHLHTPKPRVDFVDESRYALGWFALSEQWSNGVTLSHNGSNSMNFTLATVAPGVDRAYAVASNAGSPAADKATQELMDAINERFH